jgi:hypothetical protein
MESNAIVDGCCRAAEAAGFRRKGRKGTLWASVADVVLLVVELQRSRWGPQYYVNMGVLLDASNGPEWPKPVDCNVSFRATIVDRDRQPYWDRVVFNLEDASITDDERLHMVSEFLISTAIPFLRQCSKLDYLRELYGSRSGVRFDRVAHELLSLS